VEAFTRAGLEDTAILQQLSTFVLLLLLLLLCRKLSIHLQEQASGILSR
jgi:hypothetical protein